MKYRKKQLKKELASSLRAAYDRMRLLKDVRHSDLTAMIETWELLEKEIHADDHKRAHKHQNTVRTVYVDNSAGHGAYRARGGLDLP